VPFDAVEFDPLIAAGDVLYDLAFLLMDLVERGLTDAANRVLNRYLFEARGDENLDALVALPLFMSLRAAIRAKVTAARLDQGADKRDAITGAARTYFKLACDLISPPAPKLVAVGGLSGTGKSILARALAPHVMPSPGAVLLRSDVERKSLFGVGETDRLPAEAYSTDAGARVYAALNAKARRIIAAGHSVVVDAVFARPEERAAVGALFGSLSRAVPHRGPRDANDARRRSPRRGLRCGCQGGARAGGLRPRRARLADGRLRRAHRRTRSSMPKLRLRMTILRLRSDAFRAAAHR
jgi:hypothetical protein